jgi:hypothetical protein
MGERGFFWANLQAGCYDTSSRSKVAGFAQLVKSRNFFVRNQLTGTQYCNTPSTAQTGDLQISADSYRCWVPPLHHIDNSNAAAIAQKRLQLYLHQKHATEAFPAHQSVAALHNQWYHPLQGSCQGSFANSHQIRWTGQ